MGVVARLKKTDLLITGYIDERSPNIKNGLVKYFPFDGTPVGQNAGNIIDPEKNWKLGTTGTQGIYTENGSYGENIIIMGENPWGREEPVWACIQNDAASNADGGWEAYGVPVDNTKRYRFSVWVKRENVGDGGFHFGCQHSTVSNLGTTTVNVNPYFVTGVVTPALENEWYLAVSYVHPYDYAGAVLPESGVYKKDGTKISGCTNYKWLSTTAYSGHRTYQYYSTSTLEKYYFARPRMEICNGDECTIQDLLDGLEDNSYMSSSSNLTLSYDGVSIEEGTNNLVSNTNGRPDTMTAAGTTPPTATLVTDYTNPFGTEAWKIVFPANSNTGYNGSRATSNTYPFTANVPYSTTTWMKVESGKESSIGLYHTGAYGFGPMTATGRRMGEWAEYKNVNFTPTTAGSNYLTVYIGASFVDTTTVHIGFSQSEQKAFATAPANGIRSSGVAIIPLNTGSNWSIGFRFTPNVSWARMFTTNVAKKMFDIYDSNTSKEFNYFDYTSAGVQTTTVPFLQMDNFIDNTINGWHWHGISVDWSPNAEYWMMITKQDGVWNKYMTAANGYFKASMTYTAQSLIDFTPNRIVFTPEFGAKYQDFVVYNRALSEDEVKSLFGSQLSLDSKGNANVRYVRERPLMPADAIYYPLAANGYDSKRFYTPSEETNITYECGAAWVGTGTTNWAPNPTGKLGATAKGSAANIGWDAKLHPYAISVTGWSNGFNGGVPSPTIGYHAQWVYEGREGSGDPCMKFIDKNDLYGQGHRWLGISSTSLGTPTSMGWAVGTVVTISWWQKSDTPGKGANPGIYHMQNSNGANGFGSAIGAVAVTEINRWERASFSFTVDSDWNLGVGCNVYVYGTVGSAYGTVWVDDIQIEAKSFMSAFVEGNIGSGSLEFNLNATHGLNWAGDWTIAYWKKPAATHTNGLTGYSIDTLGSNANTVGGGYIWYGKTIDANSIGSASPGTILPADYFNKWHLVTLVKSGSTLTITEWDIGGVNHVRTVSVNHTAANFYVTQYGYDLKLAGWDDGNTTNCWYKDLIVLKRAMTAAELTALTKTNMRAYKDKLNVTGIIREGSVLS